MSKKYTVFYIYCLVFAFTFNINKKLFAQAPQIQWQKCYGSTARDAAYGLTTAQDSGYITIGNVGLGDGDVSGYTHYPSSDIAVIKFDDRGHIKWQKCFGGSQEEFANAIIKNKSGKGYTFIGKTSSKDGDLSGINSNDKYTWTWLVKINDTGRIEWQKIFSDYFTAIDQTRDGGYIVAGYNVVAKLDSSGNIKWTKNINGQYTGSIKQTYDGGYIYTYSAAGNLTSDNFYNFQDMIYNVVKMDSTGKTEWFKTYGGSGNSLSYSCIQTSDSCYIIAGMSQSKDHDLSGQTLPPGTGYNSWILKLNDTGKIIWSKATGGTYDDRAASVIEDYLGNYVVAGTTNSTDYDLTGINKNKIGYWLVSYSPAGSINWQKVVGCSNSHVARYAAQVVSTPDSGYAVIGSVAGGDLDVTGGGYHPKYDELGTDDDGDFWIVKFHDTAFGQLPLRRVCQGSKIEIPYSTTGTFVPGITYTAQLSDMAGNFTTPVTIGTSLSSPAGYMYGTIPPDALPGGQYRIRISTGITTLPLVVAVYEILPFTVPTISYTTPICVGSPLNITINDTQRNVIYSWSNGTSLYTAKAISVASATAAYSHSYYSTVISPNGCQYKDTVTIQVLTSNVTSLSAHISATPGNTTCAGNTVKFTSSVTNARAPIYQWLKNGVPIPGANTDTLVTSNFADGDVIKLRVTSLGVCNVLDTIKVNSDSIVMHIAPMLSPSVQIQTLSGDTVCTGDILQLTSNTANGVGPTYQWQKNGVNITGANTSTYSSGSFADGDSITLKVQFISSCQPGNVVVSNTIIAHILSPQKPSVTISVVPGDTVCTQDTAKFIANVTDAVNPIFIWRKNGIIIRDWNTDSFKTNNFLDGDHISLTIVSNGICNTGSATSDTITMHVLPQKSPSVSISVLPGDTICTGDTARFMSTIADAINPTFTWLKNGAVFGGTADSLQTNTIAEGDRIALTVHSNGICNVGTTTSQPITMHVYPHITYGAPIITAQPLVFTPGVPDTLRAVVTGFSVSEFTFQWKVNNVIIPGATMPTYITNSSHNAGDKIAVVIKSKVPCWLPDSSESAPIALGVSPAELPSDNISLYPNPNKGNFSVKGVVSNGQVTLDVINMLGRVVYHNQVDVHNRQLETTINIQNKISGLYILRIRSGDQNKNIPFSIN